MKKCDECGTNFAKVRVSWIDTNTNEWIIQWVCMTCAKKLLGLKLPMFQLVVARGDENVQEQ